MEDEEGDEGDESDEDEDEDEEDLMRNLQPAIFPSLFL